MSSFNNNDNERKELTPDGPEMRSVLIRSSGPSSLLGPNSGGSRSFLKHSTPALLKTSPVVTVTQPMSQTTPPSTWDPTPLPKLPVMYLLERSHAKVKDVESQEIAARIAACLQKESIAATFQQNKAVAETPCHTQFYVTLFEDDAQVIVEVQRRNGCAFKFSQCSKAVLCAAKGVKRRAGPPAFKVPSSVMGKLPENTTEAGYQRAFELLDDPKTEQLGMTSLVQITRDAPIHSLSLDRLDLLFQRAQDDALARDGLTVLANLLHSKSIDATACSHEFHQYLLATLVHDDLHRSHQAARCLTVICQSLPDKAQLLTNTRVAHQQGLQRHQLLAESTALLNKELSE